MRQQVLLLAAAALMLGSLPARADQCRPIPGTPDRICTDGTEPAFVSRSGPPRPYRHHRQPTNSIQNALMPILGMAAGVAISALRGRQPPPYGYRPPPPRRPIPPPGYRPPPGYYR